MLFESGQGAGTSLKCLIPIHRRSMASRNKARTMAPNPRTSIAPLTPTDRIKARVPLGSFGADGTSVALLMMETLGPRNSSTSYPRVLPALNDDSSRSCCVVAQAKAMRIRFRNLRVAINRPESRVCPPSASALKRSGYDHQVVANREIASA